MNNGRCPIGTKVKASSSLQQGFHIQLQAEKDFSFSTGTMSSEKKRQAVIAFKQGQEYNNKIWLHSMRERDSWKPAVSKKIMTIQKGK